MSILIDTMGSGLEVILTLHLGNERREATIKITTQNVNRLISIDRHQGPGNRPKSMSITDLFAKKIL